MKVITKLQQRIDSFTGRIDKLELSINNADDMNMRRQIRVHYNDLITRRQLLINEREMNQ